MDEKEQLKRAIELRDEEDEEAQFQRDVATAIEAEAKARSVSKPARGKLKVSSMFPDPPQRTEIAKNDNVWTSSPNMNANQAGNNVRENHHAIFPPTKRRRSSHAPPSITTTSTTTGSVTCAAKNNTDEVPVRGAGSGGKLEAKKYDDEDTGPTFRLSEVIGPKSEIILAIFSSYSYNVDWLYAFFDPTTPIILVNQPGEDGNSGLKQLPPNLLMTMEEAVCIRRTAQFGLYHAVLKANFVDYDWRDIERFITAWVTDVPLRQTTIRHDPKATDFPGTLQRVLHTLNVPPALTKRSVSLHFYFYNRF
ncbi:hypothetical protein ACEPAG_9743 [Sanghuangporus baumii]